MLCCACCGQNFVRSGRRGKKIDNATKKLRRATNNFTIYFGHLKNASGVSRSRVDAISLEQIPMCLARWSTFASTQSRIPGVPHSTQSNPMRQILAVALLSLLLSTLEWGYYLQDLFGTLTRHCLKHGEVRTAHRETLIPQ